MVFKSRCSFLSVVLSTLSSFSFAQGLKIKATYCEYRSNPEGIDVMKPRLSWKTVSGLRNDKPIAFQIIIASSISALKKGKEIIWNSKKQFSDQNSLEYAGPKLLSGKIYYWKIRAWDRKGNATTWSKTAFWSMGLLSKSDWKAQWITDPILADPANFPQTPINCFRTQTTSNQFQQKWIILDLGTEKSIDGINLLPARGTKQNMDFPSVMFPLRYKIQIAKNKDFRVPQTIVDESSADVLNPREAKNQIKFKLVKTRYIRLLVTKLAKWDVNLYGLALAGFQPTTGQNPIRSADISIDCSDSIESLHYSKKFLLENENNVTNAPDPTVLSVKVKELSDIPAINKVSRVPTLRREFISKGKIKRATLYVTARGFYEFHINGKKVSHQFLVPGVTDFNKRITYQSYDVTNMLHSGNNAIGAMLGYGWYAGHMNLFENRNIYGHYPMLMAQMELEFADGKRQTIVTDKEWKTTLEGALLWSDLLDGEAVDQRRALKGWDMVNFNDRSWLKADVKELDNTKLVWQRSQPVKEIRELTPISTKQVGKGIYVFDFGQEIAGWCRLQVSGRKNMHIRIKHAELLKASGEVDMKNLWGIPQQENYILNSEGPQTLTPHFTYHGFRYVEVSGLDSPPNAGTITAISMHNDAPEAGRFLSSNPLYNKLMETAIWTQRNLMFDMPNGCAARSERLGWTGDLRPCVQSLIYNMDVGAFLEKYAQDMRDEQTTDGRFTDIAPQFHLKNTNICVGSPGWADAGVSMPYQAYVNYGDKRMLEEHYPAARKWVEFILSKNPGFIWEQNRGMDWGDWISAGPETPKTIGSTAFFANDADLLSKMAAILGKKEDAIKYAKLFKDIKNAFCKRFVSPEGIIREIGGTSDAQGSYALAIHFKLLDEPLQAKAVKRLAYLIKENGGHLTTGFWSSIEMLLALSDHDQHQTASLVANTKTQPSWGYMLEAGGTTFWESFDADKRNLSLNHWTYSSIGEWLWRNAAGLKVDENNPGYKHFFVEPKPEGPNDFCKSEYESINGTIKIDWKLLSGRFSINLTIPPGSTSTLRIPFPSKQITESGILIEKTKGVKLLKKDTGGSTLLVQSGTYDFVAVL